MGGTLYATGGWADATITPLYAAVFPSAGRAGNRIEITPTTPPVVSDVERVKAEGVSAVVALRVLAALDWDADRAVAVVRAAKEDGVKDVAELARQIGAVK